MFFPLPSHLAFHTSPQLIKAGTLQRDVLPHVMAVGTSFLLTLLLFLCFPFCFPLGWSVLSSGSVGLWSFDTGLGMRSRKQVNESGWLGWL